jgi:hypothetical protein
MYFVRNHVIGPRVLPFGPLHTVCLLLFCSTVLRYPRFYEIRTSSLDSKRILIISNVIKWIVSGVSNTDVWSLNESSPLSPCQIVCVHQPINLRIDILTYPILYIHLHSFLFYGCGLFMLQSSIEWNLCRLYMHTDIHGLRRHTSGEWRGEKSGKSWRLHGTTAHFLHLCLPLLFCRLPSFSGLPSELVTSTICNRTSSDRFAGFPGNLGGKGCALSPPVMTVSRRR